MRSPQQASKVQGSVEREWKQDVVVSRNEEFERYTALSGHPAYDMANPYRSGWASAAEEHEINIHNTSLEKCAPVLGERETGCRDTIPRSTDMRLVRRFGLV